MAAQHQTFAFYPHKKMQSDSDDSDGFVGDDEEGEAESEEEETYDDSFDVAIEVEIADNMVISIFSKLVLGLRPGVLRITLDESECATLLAGGGLTFSFYNLPLIVVLNELHLMPFTEIGFQDSGDATFAVMANLIRRNLVSYISISSRTTVDDAINIARMLANRPNITIKMVLLPLDVLHALECVVVHTQWLHVYYRVSDTEREQWLLDVVGGPHSLVDRLSLVAFPCIDAVRTFWRVQERGGLLHRVSAIIPSDDTLLLSSNDYMFSKVRGVKLALLAMRSDPHKSSCISKMPVELMNLVGRMLIGYVNTKID